MSKSIEQRVFDALDDSDQGKSFPELSVETGLTTEQVRRAIVRLGPLVEGCGRRASNVYGWRRLKCHAIMNHEPATEKTP